MRQSNATGYRRVRKRVAQQDKRPTRVRARCNASMPPEIAELLDERPTIGSPGSTQASAIFSHINRASRAGSFSTSHWVLI